MFFQLLRLLILLCFLAHSTGGNVYTKAHRCPGLYCGRVSPSDTCGACPRGYRPDNFSNCQKCDDRVTFYDSLYLGFMALVSLMLHWFFIDYQTRAKRSVILLHLSALVESMLAALLTLVLSDPVGDLDIRSCRVQQLADWYTMLYNPSPNYTVTLHCTQEVVYPLYTMVMIYYAFSMGLMMLVRPFISFKFVDGRGTKSIYAALYFLPILIVTQAVLGGLIYYSFPYIILVVSVVTNAVHLASMNEDSMHKLVKKCLTSPRHIIILVGHWLLHAYGIIALTRMEEPGFHAPFIALVPFPAIFYILTVHFTNPDNLDRVT